MYLMNSVNDLKEHISYTILYAPDFPYRDFLEADDPMTLDSAFEQLRDGVKIAYPEDEWLDKCTSLYQLLEQSYTAFKASDGKVARQLLYDFQNNIFKPENTRNVMNDT